MNDEKLFGLKLLLRKEFNRDHKTEEKEETSHKNDYGPISHAVGKGITKKEMEESENWEILENFSKFTKKVNNVTKEYLKSDTNLIEPSRGESSSSSLFDTFFAIESKRLILL